MNARRRLVMTFGVVCLAGLLASPLLSTSIKPMPIETLTNRADLVVEARAEQSWSQWNAQHTLIYTYTRFIPSRTLKGIAPARLVVKQIGGSAGGYTQHVAGVHHWLLQEEAVLFLRASLQEPGMMSVVGLMQGSFRIGHSLGGELFASNGVPGVEIYAPGEQAAQEYSGTQIPLAELERQVLRAVKK